MVCMCEKTLDVHTQLEGICLENVCIFRGCIPFKDVNLKLCTFEKYAVTGGSHI